MIGTTNGTMTRGAEGSLYFIPAGGGPARRVDEEPQAPELAGLTAAQPIPQITPLSAVRGTLTKRDLAAGPAAIVPPATQLRGLRQRG